MTDALPSPRSRTRVVVYRLGSIGDFVVSLPCLHFIRAKFPAAEIALLTNWPVESRAAPAMSILEGTGLVDRCIAYPVGTRDPFVLTGVARELRVYRPDLLIYLMSRSSLLPVVRDNLFFRLCGIPRVVGAPWTTALREPQPSYSRAGLWEPEAHRLARCIAPLGAIDCERKEGWDLHLSRHEIGEAGRLLTAGLPQSSASRLIGLSIGTKQSINDWGDAKWQALISGLKLSGYGLILIGAAEDSRRSEALAARWTGPSLNLCGKISPRVSAAVMRSFDVFLCHDSGPMHLAAAVGTPCVALFSNKDRAGQWYPFGSRHEIVRPASGSASIRTIAVSEMAAAVTRALADSTSAPLGRSYAASAHSA